MQQISCFKELSDFFSESAFDHSRILSSSFLSNRSRCTGNIICAGGHHLPMRRFFSAGLLIKVHNLCRRPHSAAGRSSNTELQRKRQHLQPYDSLLLFTCCLFPLTLNPENTSNDTFTTQIPHSGDGHRTLSGQPDSCRPSRHFFRYLACG